MKTKFEHSAQYSDDHSLQVTVRGCSMSCTVAGVREANVDGAKFRYLNTHLEG